MSFETINVVTNAFKLSWRNMFQVAAIFIIYSLIAFAVVAITGWSEIIMLMNPYAGPSKPAGLFLLGLLVAQFIMIGAALAASKQVTSDATGAGASFGKSMSVKIKDIFVAFLMPIVLYTLISIGAVILMIVGMALPQGMIMILVLAGLIGVLWLASIFTPFFPILVSEGKGLASFTRSFELTKGYCFPIFGGVIVMAIAAVVLAVIIFLATGLFVSSLVMSGSMSALAISGVLTAITYFVTFLFFSCLGISYQSAVYARLVEIKDAE